MAGGKETPRQKMIGMMYLVLTALLALNVSKEILDAFVTMNNSLIRTDQNFESRNAALYALFDKTAQSEGGKAMDRYNLAKQIKTEADSLHAFIQSLKIEVIRAEEGASTPKDSANAWATNMARLKSKDKYDQTTRIMCGDKPDGSTGQARALKNKIDAFKNSLIAKLDADKDLPLSKNVNLGLDTSDPPNKGTQIITWETEKFYHSPLAAVVSILTQLQTEVRNAEGEAVNELFKSLSMNIIKIDDLVAKAIPNSNFVTIGDEFQAEIFVAAQSATMVPEVSVNGTRITQLNDNGTGVVFKQRPSSEGEQKVTALVKFKNAKGRDTTSKVEFSYIAAKPAATVSPTKMNVFYIGVDNPVSIGAPGVAAANVEASIAGGGGTLTKVGNGEYIVKVTTAGKCSISVQAKNTSGTGKINLGTSEFRVKTIPDPTPQVLGKKSGEAISKEELKAAGAILAVLENFDFQARFDIIGYEFGANINGQYIPVQVDGTGKFNDQVIAQIDRVRPGGRVFFGDIKARGPDGKVRFLSASFKIR